MGKTPHPNVAALCPDVEMRRFGQIDKDPGSLFADRAQTNKRLSMWQDQKWRDAPTMSYIYKIASLDLWQQAQEQGVFSGAPVDLEDGYIHFSTAAQLRETAAKHFRHQTDLVLLTISVEKLDTLPGALKWEPSRGGDLFPHLYAPMPIDAVIMEEQLDMLPDGTHSFPDTIPQFSREGA